MMIRPDPPRWLGTRSAAPSARATPSGCCSSSPEAQLGHSPWSAAVMR